MRVNRKINAEKTSKDSADENPRGRPVRVFRREEANKRFFANENQSPQRYAGGAGNRAGRSSEKERRADALALGADEGRDKLRKASGRSKYPAIRRFPNGETRLRKPQALHAESIGMQGEPGELKHLSSRRKRKKISFLSRKKTSISIVAASETERAQTGVRALRGSDPQKRSIECNGTVLGKPAGEGESPVGETRDGSAGTRVPRDTGNPVGRSGDHPARLNTTQ